MTARSEKGYYYTKAWQDHLRRMANLDSLYPRIFYPEPAKYTHPDPLSYHLTRPRGVFSPSKVDDYKPSKPKRSVEKEPVAFNYAGQPIYTRGGLKDPLMEMLKSPVWTALALRSPWWHKYPQLKPFESPYTWLHTPFYLRDSYLSPVKRTYLWSHHPVRPFAHNKWWV
ncbi:hypothetical protein J437_LFUL006250 [Ladona fulva]|uniref:Myofilin n=1 Tax=Ladona fulva TaxID=123851 RepID=A0A8K0K5V4_LADFU|nr:hypothetical protein J437_LFUL006250 [Ladona fulva]